MTLDATELVVGASGHIYVAPTGSAEPANVSSVLDAAYAELGYATEEGVKASDGKTTNNIMAWQSFYPLITLVTEREFLVGFTLQQWNRDTVALAFGGGSFVDQGGGMTKYVPPPPETLDERICVVDWEYGDEDYRLVVPRCQVSETVETNLTRSDTAQLPVTLSVLAPAAGSDPWYWLTNAEQFAS